MATSDRQIVDIIDQLVTIYKAHFTRRAAKNQIKQITASPPERISEWPWMYFVLGEFTVTRETFGSSLYATEQRRFTLPTFGEEPAQETEIRGKQLISQVVQAQLLVTPRRNLQEDDRAARFFIQPVVTLTEANSDVNEYALDCRVTGGNVGNFNFGRLGEDPISFIGVEFNYQIQYWV